MAFTGKEMRKNFRGTLFVSPENRHARRKGKELARKNQRKTDALVAKDLRETGQYTDNMQDPFFYRYYYF